MIFSNTISTQSHRPTYFGPYLSNKTSITDEFENILNPIPLILQKDDYTNIITLEHNRYVSTLSLCSLV